MATYHPHLAPAVAAPTPPTTTCTAAASICAKNTPLIYPQLSQPLPPNIPLTEGDFPAKLIPTCGVNPCRRMVECKEKLKHGMRRTPSTANEYWKL